MAYLKAAKEKDIIGQIRQYLALKGIFHWRQNAGAAISDNGTKKRFVRFGIPGISDIIGILPGGRFLAIEVKAKGGHLTKAQEEFLEKVNKAGGLAFCASSVDEVIEKLKERR